MKVNHKTESLEEFLVKLQSLAVKAYPTPVDEPVGPLNNAVATDHARVDRKNRANENRRTFAQMERERHIIRLFKKAMPNFIRLTFRRTGKCYDSRNMYQSKTEINFMRIMSS